MFSVTPPASLGLYVHIPWCVRKCPYCDFNSHRAGGSLPETAYVTALISDLQQELELTGRRTVASVFIGGGTPSLFGADAIGRLLNGIAAIAPLASNVEITLEANPGTAEAHKFAGFRAAGVNRLSIGVQSFQDRHLAALGRIHDGGEAQAAAAMARAAGFENLNLDLMFGLPGQTEQDAARDVAAAIDLEPTHISYYQLTLEQGTPFGRRPPALPDDARLDAIQTMGQGLLAAAGYAQYEVSAYAREGRQCRHNLNYWRFGDYIGIGAGAHGKLTLADGIVRRWKSRNPVLYLSQFAENRVEGSQTVAEEDLALEFLMNHLRLREGFPVAAFIAATGRPLAALEPALSRCLADGLLRHDGAGIACTELGWRHLDGVLARFC